MRLIIKSLITFLFLFILAAVFFCSKKNVSECESYKIQILLEDLFRKKFLYFATRSLYPYDSSIYFIYLYSKNIIVPQKEFYLHWDKYLTPTYPDSVFLRRIDSNLIKEKNDANIVGISLIDVNEDTTKLKVAVGYATYNNIAIDEATFSYLFDPINCKWVVIDSNVVKY